MSSAISIELLAPINVFQWRDFCQANGIHHNPQVVDGNVYYRDDVQICFEPQSIIVSTYWLGNICGVADVALDIMRRWRVTQIYPAPELIYPLYPLAVDGSVFTLGQAIELVKQWYPEDESET